jgi:hypothetical protein
MKKKWWTILFLLTIPLAVALLYDMYSSSNDSPSTFFSFESINSAIANLILPETTTEATTITTTTESTTTTTTTTPFEIVIDITDRIPSYKLATRDGRKPRTDAARDKLIDVVHLYDVCDHNSSNIVVDVGANLGKFKR